MPFSITFENAPLIYPYDDPGTAAATGLLVLGEHKEEFVSSLFQWSQRDYEKQWSAAIKVLLRGKRKSALITEYVSPDFATHLVWWPMYVVEEIVYFHHQLLFYDQLLEPFSVENALSFLRDREIVNPEGQRISEWAVEFREIEEFALMLEQSNS